MVLNSVLYVEIDVFAALVLLIIMERGKDRLMSLSQKLFRTELVVVVLVLLSDALTWALNGRTFPGARTCSLLANYAYWFLTILPCYIGLLYCRVTVTGQLGRRWALLMAIPIAAGAVLLVMNFANGWIFTVSGNNVYARGPYFLAVGALPFVHMAAAVLITLRAYFRAQLYERKMFIMLAFFMTAPLFGALLQIFIYGLVTTWICLTLSMLMCYVYIQSGTLATDPLTGLNNRGRFDAYSAWLWENRRDYPEICLLILDIDRFKSINDTYGHAEGDQALMRAANVLKSAMAEQRGFLARIGGDEFAVLLTAGGRPEADRFMERLRVNMAISNADGGKPYRVCFSVGCASLQPDELSFRSLFARADQQMYLNKGGKNS